MKVNNIFLSKIIQEEIKKILYKEESEDVKFSDPEEAASRIQQISPDPEKEQEESLAIELIHLINDFYEASLNNPGPQSDLEKEFFKSLKSISPDLQGEELILFLQDRMDRQKLSFMADLLKRDPSKVNNGGYTIPPYEIPPSYGKEQAMAPYNKGQTDAFMRAPEHKGPYDSEQQIDFRRKEKNLTKEYKMKVTKELLKKLIVEQIKEASDPRYDNMTPEERAALEKQRAAKLQTMTAGDEPQPAKQTAGNPQQVQPQTAPTMQQRNPIQPNVQKLSAIYKDAWQQLITIKNNLDVLTKEMAQAGRMLNVQLEEQKKKKE